MPSITTRAMPGVRITSKCEMGYEYTDFLLGLTMEMVPSHSLCPQVLVLRR